MHNIQVRLVIYLFSTLIGLLFISFIYLTEILGIFNLKLTYDGEVQNVETLCVAQVKQRQFDLETDDSFEKFVNNEISFEDVAYVPEDLLLIDSKYVFDSKGNGRLRIEANQALQDLAKLFYSEFNRPLSVVSSYRSYNYQKGIKDGGCPDNLCAKAGFSEHQSGLAVDLFSASNKQTWEQDEVLQKYGDWLQGNAYLFGFTNTYQKGLDIDGYEIEPWHWRYVGDKLARQLQNEDITLAEYYQKQKK